jgi:L-serine dehydratase
MEYRSIETLVREAEDAGKRISDMVLAAEAEAAQKPARELFAVMKGHLDVMREAAEKGSGETLRSASGLSGGDGFRMKLRVGADPVCGPFCAKALARAIAIAEYNAAMGKIVAAPTAGSCGILPAAVLTMMEERGVSCEDAVMSLFTAGALGMVIAHDACVSGAEGGCQAECGSAAGITAGALVELAGGTPAMAGHACAIAIKNQLGLVCDPVAGLVEVPCVKRNAGGVMCAIAAADMALAGIRSVIPPDEVIAAMREVGEALPSSLRETAQGGLAATPTALALKDRIFG